MSTIGLSPKLFPAVLAILVGIVLVIVHERDTGLAVLLTGVGGLGLGYAAPPGVVSGVVPDGEDGNPQMPS